MGCGDLSIGAYQLEVMAICIDARDDMQTGTPEVWRFVRPPR